MRTTALIVFTGLVLAASLLTVRLRYFTVDRDGNALVLTWETDVEADVQSFELFRKNSQSPTFARVAEVDAHGTGLPYAVRDDGVYKTGSEMIDYRLEVVYSNGLRQHVAEKKVNYTPTAIRRSWGSIKAMFQD